MRVELDGVTIECVGGDIAWQDDVEAVVNAAAARLRIVPITVVAACLAAAAGEVEGGRLRWVIYTPGATAETTGLTTEPRAAGPWLMFPGTPGAHIMITPPPEEQEEDPTRR